MILSKSLITEMEKFAEVSIKKKRTKFTPEEMECVKYLHGKGVSRKDTAIFMEKHFGKKYDFRIVKDMRAAICAEEGSV